MSAEGDQAELEIRPIRPDDAEPVAELAEQLGYPRTVAAVRAWIESSHNGNTAAAFVACRAGEVIGWIEVSIQHRLQSDPFALIGGLVVRESARSRGIGRQLCEQAEEWGSERHAQTIRVTSRNSRADAHRFYLQSGYRETKTSVVFEKPAPANDAPNN